ncbi:MAG: helix-turn-helix transcriptional regulator [Saprospiraceae bacterium]|nr:helix-turn-helix transcriptional regulator [Saprospiraceae bacterium]
MIQRSNPWLQQVDNFIQNNLSDSSLCISQIADSVYTSERQFYRRIKKLTGLTPNEYLKRKRLEKAQEKINRGYQSSVSNLASSVGYNRTDYFSKLYQSKYGKRPTELI